MLFRLPHVEDAAKSQFRSICIFVKKGKDNRFSQVHAPSVRLFLSRFVHKSSTVNPFAIVEKQHYPHCYWRLIIEKEMEGTRGGSRESCLRLDKSQESLSVVREERPTTSSLHQLLEEAQLSSPHQTTGIE